MKSRKQVDKERRERIWKSYSKSKDGKNDVFWTTAQRKLDKEPTVVYHERELKSLLQERKFNGKAVVAAYDIDGVRFARVDGGYGTILYKSPNAVEIFGNVD